MPKPEDATTDESAPFERHVQTGEAMSAKTTAQRKAMGLPPVERTVDSIPEADLLRRVVRHVARTRKRRNEFAWAAVSEAFGLGSTYSAQLLRRFGIDPDTGVENGVKTGDFKKPGDG